MIARCSNPKGLRSVQCDRHGAGDIPTAAPTAHWAQQDANASDLIGLRALRQRSEHSVFRICSRLLADCALADYFNAHGRFRSFWSLAWCLRLLGFAAKADRVRPGLGNARAGPRNDLEACLRAVLELRATLRFEATRPLSGEMPNSFRKSMRVLILGASAVSREFPAHPSRARSIATVGGPFADVDAEIPPNSSSTPRMESAMGSPTIRIANGTSKAIPLAPASDTRPWRNVTSALLGQDQSMIPDVLVRAEATAILSERSASGCNSTAGFRSAIPGFHKGGSLAGNESART